MLLLGSSRAGFVGSGCLLFGRAVRFLVVKVGKAVKPSLARSFSSCVGVGCDALATRSSCALRVGVGLLAGVCKRLLAGVFLVGHVGIPSSLKEKGAGREIACPSDFPVRDYQLTAVRSTSTPERRMAQLIGRIMRSARLSVWNIDCTGAATTFGAPAVPICAGRGVLHVENGLIRHIKARIIARCGEEVRRIDQDDHASRNRARLNDRIAVQATLADLFLEDEIAASILHEPESNRLDRVHDERRLPDVAVGVGDQRRQHSLEVGRDSREAAASRASSRGDAVAQADRTDRRRRVGVQKDAVDRNRSVFLNGIAQQLLDRRNVERSVISRVIVVITAIFFGVRVTLVKPALRTGIGAPSATNEPATVGVAERVGRRSCRCGRSRNAAKTRQTRIDRIGHQQVEEVADGRLHERTGPSRSRTVSAGATAAFC
jgi:hypothetical protein